MGTYTIGETAERTGFSASALRYYDDIGLVSPAGRTSAGYRLYDDRGLTRLAFIARAKQLGCTLEEITDLVAVWDGEECGPVQRRLHDLVTAKIDDAQRQVGELEAFAAELRRTAAQLAGPAIDDPCGPGCACLVVAESEPPPAAPIACTLQPDALPSRIAEWRDVLAATTRRTTTASGGLRLELADDAPLGALVELAQAEQRCCAFFSFTVTVEHRGVALEVVAPDGADDVVHALFGAASEPVA